MKKPLWILIFLAMSGCSSSPSTPLPSVPLIQSKDTERMVKLTSDFHALLVPGTRVFNIQLLVVNDGSKQSVFPLSSHYEKRGSQLFVTSNGKQYIFASTADVRIDSGGESYVSPSEPLPAALQGLQPSQIIGGKGYVDRPLQAVRCCPTCQDGLVPATSNI